MKNLIIALAATGLLGMPVKAGQSQASDQQIRLQAASAEARANAQIASLVQTYRQLLTREESLTPEERRRLANSIDEGRLNIPALGKIVNEVYRRFRGDRVLFGVSFGLGGEYTLFRNSRVPLLNRVPWVQNMATGVDASVGLASVLVRNSADGAFFPQLAGYWSVGANEGTGYATSVTGGRKGARAGPSTRGATQGFTEERLFFIPRNILAFIGQVQKFTEAQETIAHIGNLGGTYVGGGTEAGWAGFGRAASLKTDVFLRPRLPDTTEEAANIKDVLAKLTEVFMVSVAPTVGTRGPRLEARGAIQKIGFFGLYGIPNRIEEPTEDMY